MFNSIVYRIPELYYKAYIQYEYFGLPTKLTANSFRYKMAKYKELRKIPLRPHQ